MNRLLLNDERGAVTVDWVTLTAGVLLFGIMVIYTVMNDSAGYLMDEFEVLNAQYAADAIDVSALDQQIDINR
ncbi:MAG: pilus assembly protein [Alphaproteobacteria bacterium]